MNAPKKRFRVAFSFAGEKRDFLAQAAAILASRFGEKAILYDKYHEAEFGRRDLGFYLPDLYHDEADLVVVVVCAGYEQKEWCGLEWDAIFDLLKKRRNEEVMLCRFDRATVKGLYSTAGFVELDDKTPDQATALILERLALNEGKDPDFYLRVPVRHKLPTTQGLQRTRFQPLATLLHKFSAFAAFPKAELFEKNLTFFLPEELDLMTELEAALAGGGDKRLALLVGKPATGKTVIACAVALKLESLGFQVHYLALRQSLSFDDVWPDIATSSPGRSLFIVDDCHLNAEVASGIYRNFDGVASSASCLLVSRSVDAETRSSPDYFALDYVAALEAGEQCFSVDEPFDDGVERKILGIVQKRKAWLEQTGRANLVIGDERQLLANVHRNLFLVEALLSFWPEGQPLSDLSQPEVLRRVRERYFGPLSQPARLYLLQLAAVGQFETKGLVPPGAEQASEELRLHGCCTIESATGFVELPHSEFAKLLLEAHAATPEFVSNHRGLDEFTLAQIEDYVNAFKLYPQNLEELLLNLFEHKARYAYVPLLKAEPVQQRIFAYYRQGGSIDGLVNFLFKAKNYLTPAQVSRFVNELVLSNRHLNTLVQHSEKPILSFVKLLKTVHKGHREDYDRLWRQFPAADCASLLRNSGFYVVCYSIHSLNEADAGAARTLSELLDVSELAKAGQAASLSDVLGGLKHLRRVDGRKAKAVMQQFAQVDELGLSRQLGDVGFGEVAEAINDLNRIDSVSNQTLFSHIPDEFWKTLMRRCSLASLALGLSRIKDANPDGARRLTRLLDPDFMRGLTKTWRLSHLGNGLAELNKVNAPLASSLVNAMETADLAEIANRAPLVIVGKALSEISKVNPRKAAAVVSSLDRNRLVTKLEGASVKTISKAFSELYGIERRFAQQIYEATDLRPLALGISTAPVEAVGRTLCELHGVHPRRTQALIEMVDLSGLGKRLLETPLIQIGHTLTELNRADAKQAQALYRLLPVERLAKKARSESLGFQKLGTLISQFVEVDTAENKTRNLLQQLGIDDLVRWARHGRFEELSAGLQDIAKCDMATAKAILSSLDFRALEVSARVEQFEKLCPGLKRLALIDVSKADSLLRRFSPRELAQSASHLRVDLLASCLSDLAEVNTESARLVLKSVSIETIVQRLASLKSVQAKQAVARFANVDRAFAQDLRRLFSSNSPHQRNRHQRGQARR
jgi:hypothetical protein